MKKYFLHDGTNQIGPFDFEDLKFKNISRNTSIWYEGLSEWTIAEKVEELESLFTSTPPPFSKPLTPPPILKPQIKEAGAKGKNKKSSLKRYSLLFAGFLVLGIVGLFLANRRSINENYYNNSSLENYEAKVMSVDEIERSEPTKFLFVEGKYNLNFLGDKIKIHGEIKNTATVAIYKDAVIKVSYLSKSNTVLGTNNYTIYGVFPPTSKKHFELKIENYKDVNSITIDVIGGTPN